MTVTVGHAIRSVSAARALGAAVDGQSQGDSRLIYTPANVRAMRSAGFDRLTYRLRTELGAEAWHWNARGRFDAAGYWTDATAGGGEDSYGYRLPHRGDTIDQANDDGYSRLDDGDEHTYWKSNPYLDRRLAGDRHPQWAILDLGGTRDFDAVRIDWARPYARRFEVQRWDGGNAIFINGSVSGAWRTLTAARSRGGRQLVRLGRQRSRFVRLLLLESSHTGPRGDVRRRLGFAIRELRVGMLRGHRLGDLVVHARSHRQSTAYASSIDPAHSASDRDTGIEQPGFARVAGSGLIRRGPTLIPVPLLYGTPQEAVSEVEWWRAHGLPVEVELGEEPDGQLAEPEDYASLYLRFARALRRRYPRLRIGGPSFATSIPDWEAWPDARGRTSWTGRFVAYLRAHHGLGTLDFFSFEWYPFDDVCAAPPDNLLSNAELLRTQVAEQRRAGLPRVPIYMTEYGYSAYAGEAEVDRAGAVFDADAVGSFLALGGSRAYLYGIEPEPLMREVPDCRTWGNLVLFRSDDSHRIRQPVAAYWAARLMTRRWLAPASAHQALHGATTSETTVHAYALARGRRWSLLLVNMDGAAGARTSLASARGPLCRRMEVDQLSSADYVWHARGAHGSARPDRPPVRIAVPGSAVDLPPMSVTVVRC